MDRKDEELQKALDDIFGNSVTINKTDDEKSKELDETFEEQLVIEEISSITSDEEVIEEQQTNDDSFEKTLLLPINEIKENSFAFEQEKEEVDEKSTEETISESLVKDNNDGVEEIVNDSAPEESSISINKFIIYFLIGILIGFVAIYLLLNSSDKRTMVSNCSFTAEDANYKINEEYKITYTKNSISYVEGSYLYNAKTEEYKKQIDYIKEDILPIIINSNGMSGFTYMYETSSDSFKVNSYLNYEEFNMEKIKKIDQEITPISFFEIDLSKNYEKLEKTLENKGFKCTNSK